MSLKSELSKNTHLHLKRRKFSWSVIMEGYNVYCKTEKYFARINQYSFMRNLPTINWSPQEKYLLLEIEGSEISSVYVYDVRNGQGNRRN